MRPHHARVIVDRDQNNERFSADFYHSVFESHLDSWVRRVTHRQVAGYVPAPLRRGVCSYSVAARYDIRPA